MVSRLKQTSDSLQELVDSQADFIIDCQLPSGSIPWYRGSITDPWDHIEGAIALDLCGRFREAAAAYHWSRETQNPDGSWANQGTFWTLVRATFETEMAAGETIEGA